MSLTFKFLEPYTKETFFKKFINILLYPTTNSSDFNTKYLKGFLDDLTKDIRVFAPKDKQNDLKTIAEICQSIISIKGDKTTPDPSYNDIHDYFTNLKNHLFTSNIISQVNDSKIKSEFDFSIAYNDLIKELSLYYQLKVSDKTLHALDDFINERYDNIDGDMRSSLSEFKKIIEEVYHSLNDSQIFVNDNKSTEFDYYDEESLDLVVKETIEYLEKDFVILKTGIDIIDNNIYGLMSGKTYLVCAPSNHGKSLLLQNLVYNVIRNNGEKLEGEKDVIVLWLAEDDKYNGQKRAMSIYGNYNPGIIADLHFFLSENKKKYNKQVKNEFETLFRGSLKDSIITHTNGKCRLKIKHSEEGTTSAADIIRYIEELKYQGYNVKALFTDYIEAFKPSISRGSSTGDDYTDQGTIVKEFRGLARLYAIPHVTASQLQRYADDATRELTNSLIGDSKRKIDYADYVLMLRQMKSVDPLSDDVQRFVNKNKTNNNKENPLDNLSTENNDIRNKLIPVQIAITKSKDGSVTGTEYVLICSSNLRILTDYNESIKQIKTSEIKTEEIKRKYQTLLKNVNGSNEFNITDEHFCDLI